MKKTSCWNKGQVYETRCFSHWLCRICSPVPETTFLLSMAPFFEIKAIFSLKTLQQYNNKLIQSLRQVSDKCSNRESLTQWFTQFLHQRQGARGMIKEDDCTWLSTQVTQPIQTVNWLTGSSTIISLLPGTRPPTETQASVFMVDSILKKLKCKIFFCIQVMDFQMKPLWH